MEVFINAYWSSNDTKPTFGKAFHTEIPSNQIEREMEKVALEHLANQAGDERELYDMPQDDGIKFRDVNTIPDEIWEKHGFYTHYFPGKSDFYFLDINKNCEVEITPPLLVRLAERTACMTALLVDEIITKEPFSGIDEYMTRIQDFLSHVVPLTAYSTMEETLDIFYEELQKLPEGYWTKDFAKVAPYLPHLDGHATI